MSPSRSVLVLDPWFSSSLAACRALGRAGYDVGVAGYRSGRLAVGPAASSRYVSRYHVLPDPTGPADAFEAALTRLYSKRRYDVILATDDNTLARLATVAVPVPTFPNVGAGFQSLTDKIALVEISAAAGVAYPETTAPSDDRETRRAVDRLTPPFVVKSSRSAEAGPLIVRGARGARVCWTVDQTVAAAREIREAGLHPIVQSRVRFAEKLNAVVIRRGGFSEYRYAHRVMREAPPRGGIGVALETTSAETGAGAEAADILERVCDAAGYEGVAQAEFYRSEDDGRLYVLDVNPRLWGSTWFAERLGQRVVERGVRFALGLPSIGKTAYPVGRRHHNPFGEMRWLRAQESKMRGFAELVRTTRRGDTFEYLDGGDLYPLALMALAILGGHRPV